MLTPARRRPRPTADEAIADLEHAARTGRRHRAEGLLTAGLHPREVIAALCTDAHDRRDVRERVDAVAQAVEDLAAVGLMRGTALAAARSTLAHLLGEFLSVEEFELWEDEVSERVTGLGIALPSLLAD